MANAIEGDTAFAAGILRSCFGQGGDFTVVVEEPAESSAVEAKRTEFKVWSPLLTSWSAVFDKMINSESFMERHEARVIITDFSSTSVETFLRFLYSGVVEGPLEALVEVCALADKYQVEKLQELCTQAFEKGLNARNASQVFVSAARFQLPDLRRMALETIWIMADDALESCPCASPELLEEILEPGLICTSNAELELLLNSWGNRKKRKAGEEDTVLGALEPVIERHLLRMKEESARMSAAYGRSLAAFGTLPVCAASYSEDIFSWLREACESWASRPPFLGFFLNVVLGPGSFDFCLTNNEPLEQYASNRRPFHMTANSITWMLPHDSVYLTGLSFARDMPEQVHCRVFCSKDGLHWHLAADSAKSTFEAKAPLPLSRPAHLVKWFKLEVLEGDFYNNLQVQGICKDDLR